MRMRMKLLSRIIILVRWFWFCVLFVFFFGDNSFQRPIDFLPYEKVKLQPTYTKTPTINTNRHENKHFNSMENEWTKNRTSFGQVVCALISSVWNYNRRTKYTCTTTPPPPPPSQRTINSSRINYTFHLIARVIWF